MYVRSDIFRLYHLQVHFDWSPDEILTFIDRTGEVFEMVKLYSVWSRSSSMGSIESTGIPEARFLDILGTS